MARVPASYARKTAMRIAELHTPKGNMEHALAIYALGRVSMSVSTYPNKYAQRAWSHAQPFPRRRTRPLGPAVHFSPTNFQKPQPSLC